jgi:hypothetical protein
MLTLMLPLSPRAQPRRIAVRIGSTAQSGSSEASSTAVDGTAETSAT